MEIASLVWEITKANVSWGRVRVANQLAVLLKNSNLLTLKDLCKM